MADDPVALLRSLAKQFGKSVRTLSLFDPNVCTSPWDPDQPWEVLPLPGDMFRHKVSIEFAGHEVRLRANGEFVVVEIRCQGLDIDVLSINRRNKNQISKRSPFQIPGFPSLPIFADSTGPKLRQFLASAGLKQALSKLHLEETESLHIYLNGLILYFKPDSVSEALLAVETLCSLIEKLPASESDHRSNLDGLPPRFKELSLLIRKWAVSDDELRTEMLEQKSDAALRRFVSAVEPHIRSINEYLDSFGEEAPTEAAAALGALAECATEARILLNKAKS